MARKAADPAIQQPHARQQTSPGLVERFNELALNDSNARPTSPQGYFVGGFVPGTQPPASPPKRAKHGGLAKLFGIGRRKNSRSPPPLSFLLAPTQHASSSTAVPPLPRPPAIPAMPTPQVNPHMSMTMQHALSAPANSLPRPPINQRPHSGPVGSPTTQDRLHPDHALQVRAEPPRPASAPEPSIASSKSGKDSAQCSGTTKKGERCTRLVKAPPLNRLDSDADVERFCHQHTPDVLKSTGFYSRNGNSQWIKFEDWIPSYLQSDTQAALRVEMEKRPSSSDVPGYIYAYEIRDPHNPNTFFIKVGRAVRLVKRLGEWDKQCGSKEQVLRGFWPCTLEEGETSVLKGRVREGEKGPYCHRLERLIHLELADLSIYGAYLVKGFPDVGPPGKENDGASTPNSPRRSPKGSLSTTPKGGWVTGKPCPDCGKTHKEIFAFVRPQSGRFKGKEWEELVERVIQKWGKFVEIHV